MAIAMKSTQRVADVLVESGAITRQQADDAEKQARRSRRPVSAVLVQQGWITPQALAQAMSDLLKVPVVDLSTQKVQPAALGLIPEDVARKMNVLPIAADAATLTIALEDPLRLEVIDNLRALTRRRIITVLAPYGSVQPAIDQHYRLTGHIEQP